MKQRVMIEFDKSGSEWVITAYCCGDPRMIEVCERKVSPHPITANLITRVPVPLIEKEDKVIGMITDAQVIEELRREKLPELFHGDYFLPRPMSIRQLGKKSNHGLNYLMGAREFANFAELDESDAKKVIHLYTRQAYPNLPLWWESVKRQLKDDRTVFNCFGRKRKFYLPWGPDLFKAAVAHIPQSTNVDMVDEGMIKTYRDDKLWPFWDLLMQTHDSLHFQVLFEDWKKLAMQCLKVVEYMTPKLEYGGREFTVDTDMKIGLSAGSLKKCPITKDVDKFAKNIRQALEPDQKKKAA